MPHEHDELVSELSTFAALSAPVDEETAQALLTVASACLPDHFTKVDSTELSAASTAAVMAQLPRVGRGPAPSGTMPPQDLGPTGQAVLTCCRSCPFRRCRGSSRCG